MSVVSVSFDVKMKYVAGACFLLCISLHLTQAFDQNSKTEQELHINEKYENTRTTQAICNEGIFLMMRNCQKDLYPLIRNGFPWRVGNENEIQPQGPSRRQLKNIIQDPLDPVNHLCDVFEDFLKCIDEHSIPKTCLLTGSGQTFRMHTIFNFICNKEPRTIDLLHSLRCLQETRVVDLLIFHLAHTYGTSLIDLQAQGTTNAMFRFLDIIPVTYTYFNTLAFYKMANLGLICLPESVISHHVPFIVNGKCGSQAANLIRTYYFYFRAQFNDVLDKMGVRTNICDKNSHNNPTRGIENHMTPENIHVEPPLRSFEQFLEDRSPGTALDTEYGRFVKRVIKDTKVQKFCDPVYALATSFQACLLLSYDISGKGMFNVLHYAHSMTLPYTDYPRALTMKRVNSCWSLLQQICVANSTYFEYNYLVSTGSSHIQTMMDNLTCKWQDMLIGHYIATSEDGNIWPTAFNVPKRPLLLSRGIYTLGDFQNSMSDLSLALVGG